MNDNKLPDLGLEVGDIVEAFGLKGVVNDLYFLYGNLLDKTEYIVEVDFGNRYIKRFYSDGRYEAAHKTPSLKLIEKKYKCKTIEYVESGVTLNGKKLYYKNEE